MPDTVTPGTYHYCLGKIKPYAAVLCSITPDHPEGCDFKPLDELRRMLAENARLRGIVGKLPKTADEVVIVPGKDKVWCPTTDSGDRWGGYRSVGVQEGGFISVVHCRCKSTHVTGHYSTREAAEAAQKKD